MRHHASLSPGSAPCSGREPDAEPVEGALRGREPSGSAATLRRGSWEAEIPLRLRLAGAHNGSPDIQLQLFSLRWGTAARGAPPPSAAVAGRPLGRLATARAAGGGLAQRSTALLFAGLLFPDTLAPVLSYMAVAGYVAATGAVMAELVHSETVAGWRRQRAGTVGGAFWDRTLASGERQPILRNLLQMRALVWWQWYFLSPGCLGRAAVGYDHQAHHAVPAQ